MPTNVQSGSLQAIRLQSLGLFAANMQRNTTLNRLTGKLPTQGETEADIRTQSSSKYPIVVCRDLSKMAGDEITFDLVNPLKGKPIVGGENAEGLGESLNFSDARLRINQIRKPISAGDTMSQQRTKHDLRRLARTLGEEYMNRLVDQTHLVHLAGARGYHDNIEWAVPLQSDADFSKIVVNTVKAPSRNRHFLSNGANGLELVSATSNAINIATTDTMTVDVVDALRTHLDSMPLPPSPVIFDGDKMANDSPLRVLMVSSEQYTSLVQSGSFRTWQAQARERAASAGQSPLFMGEAGLWNGILIVKMPKPIRFYGGDSLRWCASTTSETETSTDLIPTSGFGAAGSRAYAVDRALLLGGQALAYALGGYKKTGNPFFWSEKELDHDDKMEVLIGMIAGCSKIRFLIDHGNEQQYTDNGVIAIDTAVKLNAGF